MAGFLDFLRNNSDTLMQTGAGLLGGQNPQQQMAGAAQGLVQAGQRNKTLNMLRKANPELAQAVESGALSGNDAFKLYYAQKLEAEKPKNNFMAVGKNLYNFDNGAWVTPPAGSEEVEYGLQPVWGQDAEGKDVLGQLSKNGTFRQTPMPEGFKLSTGTGTVDLGTHIGTIDKRTGNVIATTPKDLAGAATQTAIGKGAGEATVEARNALPAARATAGLVSDQIQALKTDPYLNDMLGPRNSRLPNVTADANRVQSRIDQLQGGAFLQARQLLKGGGAITDYEGQKAEAAFVRMNTAQSPDDFKAALDEFNAAVQQGVAKLEAQGGQQAAPSQSQEDPLGIR